MRAVQRSLVYLSIIGPTFICFSRKGHTFWKEQVQQSMQVQYEQTGREEGVGCFRRMKVIIFDFSVKNTDNDLKLDFKSGFYSDQ